MDRAPRSISLRSSGDTHLTPPLIVSEAQIGEIAKKPRGRSGVAEAGVGRRGGGRRGAWRPRRGPAVMRAGAGAIRAAGCPVPEQPQAAAGAESRLTGKHAAALKGTVHCAMPALSTTLSVALT